MTREQLAAELDAIFPPLSAAQKRQVLLAAGEYRANGIEEHARSPRSQGGARDDAA